MALIGRVLAGLLVVGFAVSACGGSGDGLAGSLGKDSGEGGGASGAVPDPVECDLGAEVIKSKIKDATPKSSEGGPTDSCSWSSGGKRSYQDPLLVTVFAGPEEEFITMDEAKAKGTSSTKYRMVSEVGDKAWLEKGYDTKVHWQAKHVIVQLSSDTLGENDVIDIAKAVSADLTKIGA